MNWPQTAVAAFREAVWLDPNLDLAYYLVGNISLSQGNLEGTEASLKAAISINSKNALYYNYLARAYDLKGSSFQPQAMECTSRMLVNIYHRLNLRKEADEQQEIIRQLEAKVRQKPADPDPS